MTDEIESLQRGLAAALGSHSDTPEGGSASLDELIDYESNEPRFVDLGGFLQGFRYKGMEGKSFWTVLFNFTVLPVWWLLNLFATLFHELAHAVVAFVSGFFFAGLGTILGGGFREHRGAALLIALPIAWVFSRVIWVWLLIPLLRVGRNSDGLVRYAFVPGFFVQFFTAMSGYLGPVVFGVLFLVLALTGQYEFSVVAGWVLFWVLIITSVLGLLSSLIEVFSQGEDPAEIAWLQIPLSLLWGLAVWGLPTIGGEDHAPWLWFLGIAGGVLLTLGIRDAGVVYWYEFFARGEMEHNDFTILETMYPLVASWGWAIIHVILMLGTLLFGAVAVLGAYSTGGA